MLQKLVVWEFAPVPSPTGLKISKYFARMTDYSNKKSVLAHVSHVIIIDKVQEGTSKPRYLLWTDRYSEQWTTDTAILITELFCFRENRRKYTLSITTTMIVIRSVTMITIEKS